MPTTDMPSSVAGVDSTPCPARRRGAFLSRIPGHSRTFPTQARPQTASRIISSDALPARGRRTMIPNVVVEYSDRNHMRDTRFASFLLFTGIYDHVYPSSTYFVPAIPDLVPAIPDSRLLSRCPVPMTTCTRCPPRAGNGSSDHGDHRRETRPYRRARIIVR